MAKKKTKIEYRDFDDEVIPEDFVFEGCQLRKDKSCQWIEDLNGEKRAIKCSYTNQWCKGQAKSCFTCFGCSYLYLEPNSKREAVNHPLHYGGDTPYECIKVLKAWLSPEEYRGFCRGNFIKYVCRLGKKDDSVQELKKARFYLDKLIESYEA